MAPRWRILQPKTAPRRTCCACLTAWAALALLLPFAAAAEAAQSDKDAGQAAREVFKDQVYWWKAHEPSQPASYAWLEPILKALGRALLNVLEFLARIFRGLAGVFRGDASGAAVFAWILVALLLAWAFFKLYPIVLTWFEGGAKAEDAPKAVAWEALAESSLLFEQASAAYREGRYAEAIRLALLALIARLEKQGLLRYDPTRTNREYQRELRRAPEIAASFGQLARIYERVWYGRATAGAREAEEAVGLCGAFIKVEGA